MARSYDQSYSGFDGYLLLSLVEQSRMEMERLRIYGADVAAEDRHHWHIRIQEQLSAIEIGVTRLLGIPCGYGQYSLRDKTSSHPMFAAIPPLTGPYRRASGSQQTSSESLKEGSEQSQSPASSGL